jgi:hypothetical protein
MIHGGRRRWRTKFWTEAEHLPSKVIHPLEMIVVSIVVIKTGDFLDHVDGNGHADLVVSIHSRWVGVIDKSQGLVELANVREYVLEARIDSRGGPLFICSLSNRSSRRSKNLEIRENFILEIFQSLVCTNGRIVRRTEPCIAAHSV